MILNQLNLNFFSKYINIDTFELAKEAYETISEDGHFEGKLTDKKLAVFLFENSINDDFFYDRKNFINFFYALPEITQDFILNKLDLSNINDIKWDNKTSDFFINDLGLSKKFKYIPPKDDNQNKGFLYFEKPTLYFKKLKRFQSEVFFNVNEYISEIPYARCIIQMPTGSGKTRTAMEIVCETINETGKDVLWLANTEELCEQAFESFNEIWYFLRKRDAHSINHQRYKGVIGQSNSPCFHIATIQSLNTKNIHEKLKSFGIEITNLELLIVDEAHISIAPTYKKTIESMTLEGVKLIGLTATPGRQLRYYNSSSNNKDENLELSKFYFNKKFELESGTVSPIEYLRNQGILSNAKFISIEGAVIDKLLTKKEINKCLINKTIPPRIEAILTNDSTRNAVIFDQIIRLLEERKKILFFGTSIAHSKLISTLVNIKGFRAAHIDGNTGRYRKEIIQQFKNNELNVLCNYGVLTTGFDDPKIDVVFMARPTNSIVLYSQIIGRGLRGPTIGGTDFCEIYTVFDNISDLPNNNDIYSYFDEYFSNYHEQ